MPRGGLNVRRPLLAMLGCGLLCLAGCATRPEVVRVDRLVTVPPPAACLNPVAWDPEFSPYGLPGEALARSWAVRGDALDRANSQLDCLRGWAEAMSSLSERLGDPPLPP